MAQVNLGHVVGPGVPTGGTAGQVLVKNGATNFDTSWQNLNQNAALENIQDGLAIVANGNTHAAIASGQYVYVKNHGTLAEGLYKATAAIGTNATLSTSNLTADSQGGLNDLKGQVDSLNSNIVSYSLGMLNELPSSIPDGIVSFGCASNIQIGNQTIGAGARFVGYSVSTIGHFIGFSNSQTLWMLRKDSGGWSVVTTK